MQNVSGMRYRVRRSTLWGHPCPSMVDQRLVLYSKMARTSAISQGLVEVFKQEGNELLAHLPVKVGERGSVGHDFDGLDRFGRLHTSLCVGAGEMEEMDEDYEVVDQSGDEYAPAHEEGAGGGAGSSAPVDGPGRGQREQLAVEQGGGGQEGAVAAIVPAAPEEEAEGVGPGQDAEQLGGVDEPAVGAVRQVLAAMVPVGVVVRPVEVGRAFDLERLRRIVGNEVDAVRESVVIALVAEMVAGAAREEAVGERAVRDYEEGLAGAELVEVDIESVVAANEMMVIVEPVVAADEGRAIDVEDERAAKRVRWSSAGPIMGSSEGEEFDVVNELKRSDATVLDEEEKREVGEVEKRMMYGNMMTVWNLSCFHGRGLCDGCEHGVMNRGGNGLMKLFSGRRGVMDLHFMEMGVCCACLEALVMFCATLKKLCRLRFESAHQFKEEHMLGLIERFAQLAVGKFKVEVALSLRLDDQHWQDIIQDWGLGAGSWLSWAKWGAVPGEYLMPELTAEEKVFGYGGWECSSAEHNEWLCVVAGREAIWRFVEQRFRRASKRAQLEYK